MDTSSDIDGAFLWRTLTKGSGFGTGGFHRADKQPQDYRVDGLLRRADLPAYSFGFVFHGMGRTLSEGKVRECCIIETTARKCLPQDDLFLSAQYVRTHRMQISCT